MREENHPTRAKRHQQGQAKKMIYVVIVLTVLFGVSYAIYRTAKTEAVGFNALVAWVTFAVLDAVAMLVWLVWAFFSRTRQ